MQGRTAQLACAVIAATLAACADYAPKPIDPGHNADALDRRSLDDPELLAFVQAMAPNETAKIEAGKWDPASLRLAALYYHPDLQLGRSAVREADAGITTAGAWPNPSLTLSPTAHTAPIDPPWTVGAAIDLILEISGKRAARQDAARENADAARHELLATAWRVDGAVETALVDLWAAEEKAKLAAERRRLAGDFAALITARRQADAASGAETGRAETQAGEAAVAAADAAGETEDAEEALATAIGIPSAALDPHAIDFDGYDQSGEEANWERPALRRAALIGRADVQAALARYRESEAALKLAVAQQFPDFHLQPSYAYQDQDNEYAFAVTADLPILNQNQGPIAAAEARREAAAATVLAVQLRVLHEVDGALEDWDATGSRLLVAGRYLESAEALQAGTRRSFELGEANRVALVQADMDTTTARLARIDAVASRKRAGNALEAALQQPLFDGETASVRAIQQARAP